LRAFERSSPSAASRQEGEGSRLPGDSTVKALLAVRKAELQGIEAAPQAAKILQETINRQLRTPFLKWSVHGWNKDSGYGV